MNFEIAGIFLERTISLATKLLCDPENLIAEIYRKGLENMESLKSVPTQTEYLGEYLDYVKENWLQMSDLAIANNLGLTTTTIQRHRLRLGLRRRGYRKRNLATNIETSVLSDEEKNTIETNLDKRNGSIARTLCKPAFIVREYRFQLAEKYLTEHFGKDGTDWTVSQKFGIGVADCRALRHKNGLFLHRGPKKIDACELGTPQEINYALTQGGHDITSLAREKKLDVTRERIRQIIAEYGLNGKAYKRTVLWYAHRLVGREKTDLAKQLTDKTWVIAQLAEAGGVSAWSAKLGVSISRLQSYLKSRLRLQTEQTSAHGEMAELKCTFCQGSIWRSKALVERERVLRPNKSMHFCNKRCQGKWLGAKRQKK